MATEKDKYGTIYDLLAASEKAETLVRTADLAEQAGYKESALKVYVRNKLRNIYLFTKGYDTYRVNGVMATDRDAFVKHMRQKAVKASAHPLIVDRLIDCSISSFYLAIANYNNPAVDMRTEAFCLLIVNAWELLLKALIVRDEGLSAIRKDDFTITISRSIQKVYTKPDDPVRGNLEEIVRLRNEATHFVIEDLCDYHARMFQSCIINYIDCLQNKLGVKGRLDLRSRGMIVTSEDAVTIDLKAIEIKYGKEIVDDFTRLQEELRVKEETYNSSRFAIPVDYRVTVSKNATDGTHLLTINQDGTEGYFVEIPKDPEKTHPFRETEIIPEIKKRIPGFTQTAFRAIVHKEGFKKTKASPFHYHFTPTNTHTYSFRLIEVIISKHQADPKYIEQCIAKHKRDVPPGRRKKAALPSRDSLSSR